MLKDLGNMMKLQKDLKGIQKNLKKAETKAESADGSISVIVNGEFNIVNINIEESILDKKNKQNLEKQLILTINKAVQLSKEHAAKEMKKITGGMNIPGLDKFLG